MTENKRFILKENGVIDDTQLNILLDGGEDKEDMVDLLNALNDENEQLKNKIKSLTIELSTHKHPLWSTREAERVVNELKKENEQLKQQNELLSDFRDFIDKSHQKDIIENELLKQALREELEDNGNKSDIEIFDKLFNLNYEEWHCLENKDNWYPYDWEKMVKE